MSEIIESLRAELCVLHEAGVVSQAELCEFDASYNLPVDACFIDVSLIDEIANCSLQSMKLMEAPVLGAGVLQKSDKEDKYE